jgi:SAM-dependent methyltransferase
MSAPSPIERSWWAQLARQIFTSLPSTRVLHVGADDLALVEALLPLGVDASAHVANGQMATPWLTPDRVVTDPLAQARLADRSFATVVGAVAIDAEAEAGLEAQVRDVARLCDRHFVLVCRGGADDRLSTAHRRALERIVIGAGFRKHPTHLLFASYVDPVPASLPLALVFERAPTFPGGATSDLLLETNARAELRASSYALAAQIVRRLDVVVDVGGGDGAGAAILHDSSACARIVAIDDGDARLEHGRAAYAPHRRLELRGGDPTTLEGVADSSVDVVVAVDPCTWVTGGDRFLEHVLRVLIPGGRAVIAAPGLRSPGGSSCASFLARLGTVVRVERFFAQYVYAVDPVETPDWALAPLVSAAAGDEFEADGWLAIGVKDCLTHQSPRPDQIDHPRAAHPSLDARAATEGYANPWLPYGMVMTGTRAVARDLLVEFARRTLQRTPDSPGDRGAALCVLGYRLLEDDPSLLAERCDLEGTLEAYVAATPQAPIEHRWRISNAYVLGRLYLRGGRLADAERAFALCAAQDAMAYRPLIATKTVDAAFHAGWLAHRRGDVETARRVWQRGLDGARRAVGEGWEACVGPRDEAFPYGLREATFIVAAADRCYQALEWAALDDDRIRELALLAFPGLLVDDADAAAKALTAPFTDTAFVLPPRPLIPQQQDDLRGLLRTLGRPVYIWGAGALGRWLAGELGPRLAAIAGFIDSDPGKAGTRFEGKPVVAPAHALDAPAAERPYVLVASRFADEITARLESCGCTTPDDYYVILYQP